MRGLSSAVGKEETNERDSLGRKPGMSHTLLFAKDSGSGLKEHPTFVTCDCDVIQEGRSFIKNHREGNPTRVNCNHNNASCSQTCNNNGSPTRRTFRGETKAYLHRRRNYAEESKLYPISAFTSLAIINVEK